MLKEASYALVIGLVLALCSSEVIMSQFTQAPFVYKYEDKLLSKCSACQNFLPEMLQLSAKNVDAHRTDLDVDSDKATCKQASVAHQSGCNNIATAFGLHLVDTLVASSPDLMCAALPACNTAAQGMNYFGSTNNKETESGISLIDEGDDESSSTDAQSTDSALAQAALQTDATAENGVESQAKFNSVLEGMKKMMQQRQIMQMQMQQQQMMQMQLMRMRMLSIMASNREMKQRMLHMRRHIPGNCDCCQACPPPPAKA